MAWILLICNALQCYSYVAESFASRSSTNSAQQSLPFSEHVQARHIPPRAWFLLVLHSTWKQNQNMVGCTASIKRLKSWWLLGMSCCCYLEYDGAIGRTAMDTVRSTDAFSKKRSGLVSKVEEKRRVWCKYTVSVSVSRKPQTTCATWDMKIHEKGRPTPSCNAVDGKQCWPTRLGDSGEALGTSIGTPVKRNPGWDQNEFWYQNLPCLTSWSVL